MLLKNMFKQNGNNNIALRVSGHVYVSGVLILPISVIFLLDVRTIPTTMWYFGFSFGHYNY